jgi:chemotaxis protein histidine kinase CheA
MNEVTIPLKLTGVGSMKAELRQLKAEIAAATDPAQMEMLAKKAGELSDRIKDANDAVNVFASGSKFEQISNSFDGIKSSLMSLDFEEASQKSQVFASNLGKISKADISGAIKGITGTIKTLGGAFVKLGAQILANPIFLLVAVIVAIVAGIAVFLSSIGVLQKAFDFLMIPVNAIIDAFKEMTDWLGLTQYAAEENAEKMGKANEKAAESSKKRVEKITDAYDIEINKAKAAGKDTTDLEIAKSKAISKEAEGRLKNNREELAALQKVASKDNLEKRKKLREQIEAEKKILSDGSKERQMMRDNDEAEQAQKEKENAAKRKEKAKEYAKNRLDAERTIKDVEISLIANDAERELATTNEKYRRLIEDVKKNETLTGAEKVRLTKLYNDQKQAELDKAAQVQADAEKKRQEQIAAGIKAFNEAEAAKAEELQEQIYQMGLTEQQRELETNKYHYENLIAEAKRYGLDVTNLVEEQRTKEAEINKKYDEAERQAQLAKIEAEKQVRDAKIQAAGDAAQSLLNLSSLVIKDQKKLEKINKASALVQIGIDTAKAISSLVAAANSNPFNGITAGAAGIAQFASGILQITTNMVKAKQLLSNPSGNVSGGGGGSTASSSSSAAALVPQVNLFGQGNNLNTAGQLKSASATPSFVVQAVVSETDITNTQSKINKIKQGSEL